MLSAEQLTLATLVIGIVGGAIGKRQERINAAASAKSLSEQATLNAKILADQMAAKAAEDEKHRQWEREDRAARQAEVLSKIDSNTERITTQSKAQAATAERALDAANHVNEKIVTVAQDANSDAVASRADMARSISAIAAKLDEYGKEIATIRTTGEETRRMLELRLSRQA